tara:strand:- start:2127 stop:2753 length:627 start_codon:yes stop_codon:yes gene_type:complete
MALTQFNEWEPTLGPVNGLMQQEPRIFAHDAKLIVIGAINNSDANHGIKMSAAGTGYVVGELITITTGTNTGAATGDRAVIKVLAIGAGGVITDYEVSTVGAKYLVGDTANQVSSNESGTGFQSTVTNIDIPNTQQRGCCIYVGDVATAGSKLSLILESATHNGTAGTGYTALTEVEFEGTLAGGVYPFLIKQLVYVAQGAEKVIALY